MSVTTVIDHLGVREITIPDDEPISFSVRAPATFSGDLSIVSGSLITDGFTVSGSFGVPGDLSVGGNLAVTGTFSVPGNLSVGVLDSSDVYVSDGLFVSGTATLAGIALSVLDATDAYIASDLFVSGASTFGATTLSVLDATDAYVSDDLFVSGALTNAGGLTVSAGSSEISGSLSVSGSFVQKQQYATTGAGTYTVSIGDDNQMIEASPAGGTTTIELPSTLDVGTFIYIRQMTAGTVTISGSAGVTVNSTAGTEPSLSAQWGHATADKRSGTDWVVAGDIS